MSKNAQNQTVSGKKNSDLVIKKSISPYWERIRERIPLRRATRLETEIIELVLLVRIKNVFI